MNKILGGIRSIVFIFIILLSLASKAYSYSSIMDFESNSTTEAFFGYVFNLNWCYNNLIFTPQEMNNIELPVYIKPNSPPKVKSGNVGSEAMGTEVADYVITVGGLMASFIAAVNTTSAFDVVGAGEMALVAALALIANIMPDLEMCTNAYVVQPWEYISRSKGGDYWDCQSKNGNYYNAGQKAITSIDVPFYYSCDPKHNTTPNQISKQEEPDMEGLYWGYMGSASQYCVGKAKGYAMPDKVGAVRLEATSGWGYRFWLGDYGRCSTNNRAHAWMKAGDWATLNGIEYYAYYKYNNSGKVQICVAAPIYGDYSGGKFGTMRLANLEVGCSQVAPPNTDFSDAELLAETESTRCYYFFDGRKDLHSLGQALNDHDTNGHSGVAMKGFLESDLHIASTMVGCINDMLVKVFFGKKLIGGQGFFSVVQQRLAGIVYAALTLYVAIIGIRIISSPQVPSYGQFMMFLIKFMLVVYFTTDTAWYYIINNEIRGLFYSILWIPEEIGSWFISAVNSNDPMGYCRYEFEQGKELLDQRSLNPATFGANVTPTMGNNTIQINLWDLMDCKFVNYLNFGSCNYSINGMVAMWMVNAALLVTGSGVLLAISTFVYAWIMLLVFFKYAHIFILSALVTSLLILLSPIFLCFSLFESTKNIFQAWFKLIIGYILYPSLLVAFVALMLMTLDSIYYGFMPKHINSTEGITTFEESVNKCRNVNSVYCTTINHINSDPCSMNLGQVANSIAESKSFGPLGNFTTLNTKAASNYWSVVWKLLVFALIFYFFLGTVVELIAVLVGVRSMDSISKGSFDMMAMVQSVAGKVMDKGSGMAGGAMGSMTKLMNFGSRGSAAPTGDVGNNPLGGGAGNSGDGAAGGGAAEGGSEGGAGGGPGGGGTGIG